MLNCIRYLKSIIDNSLIDNFYILSIDKKQKCIFHGPSQDAIFFPWTSDYTEIFSSTSQYIMTDMTV